MAKNNPGEPYTRISTEEAFNKINSEKDREIFRKICSNNCNFQNFQKSSP